jgi:hypothetical protein
MTVLASVQVRRVSLGDAVPQARERWKTALKADNLGYL